MTEHKINPRYYINVLSKMIEKECLPRPTLKRTVLVTGWNEFLPIITVTTHE